MKTGRTLVVGSGAGGLTLALLLARTGHAVTLVEKQPSIGGYLRRFVRDGCWWDTGYHFSGGFRDILKQLAQILGMDDWISAHPIPNRIILKQDETEILLPAGCGHDGAMETFCRQFPGEAAGIKELFDAVRTIWTTRQMENLCDLTPLQMNFSRYDTTTVREFCGRLGLSPAAETAAGSFAACHGTPISEAPMSFHARVGFALYDSLARPHEGGAPFIRAFRKEAEKLNIEIRTGAELLRFAEPDSDGECHEARFADGDPLTVDKVFFTVHPLTVRELLPEKMLTPTFQRRCARLRETTSFFCAYYQADDDVDLPEGLISCFSENDLDSILQGTGGYSTGYMAVREPDLRGRLRNQITAFRTMPCGTPGFAAGRSAAQRKNDAAYREFKEKTTESITQDLLAVCPHLKGHLKVVETGSPLTCLDYDPPTGSAYGVRSICGQARLCGQLPVNNFYLAGQSAMVPGVMGTMMASLVVFRIAVGEKVYRQIIENSFRG